MSTILKSNILTFLNIIFSSPPVDIKLLHSWIFKSKEGNNLYVDYGGMDEANQRIEIVFEPLRYAVHLLERELITSEVFRELINGKYDEEMIRIVSVKPTTLKAMCLKQVYFHVHFNNGNWILQNGLNKFKERIGELELPETIAEEIFVNIRRQYVGDDYEGDSLIFEGQIAYINRVLKAKSDTSEECDGQHNQVNAEHSVPENVNTEDVQDNVDNV